MNIVNQKEKNQVLVSNKGAVSGEFIQIYLEREAYIQILIRTYVRSPFSGDSSEWVGEFKVVGL